MATINKVFFLSIKVFKNMESVPLLALLLILLALHEPNNNNNNNNIEEYKVNLDEQSLPELFDAVADYLNVATDRSENPKKLHIHGQDGEHHKKKEFNIGSSSIKNVLKLLKKTKSFRSKQRQVIMSYFLACC